MGEVVLQVQRVDDIHQHNHQDGEDMPDVGEPVADHRRAAVGLLAYPTGHRLAQLQDQDKRHHADDETDDPLNELIAAIGNAKREQKHGDEKAVDTDDDEAHGPDVDIGGRLVAQGHGAHVGQQRRRQTARDGQQHLGDGDGVDKG